MPGSFWHRLQDVERHSHYSSWHSRSSADSSQSGRHSLHSCNALLCVAMLLSLQKNLQLHERLWRMHEYRAQKAGQLEGFRSIAAFVFHLKSNSSKFSFLFQDYSKKVSGVKSPEYSLGSKWENQCHNRPLMDPILGPISCPHLPQIFKSNVTICHLHWTLWVVLRHPFPPEGQVVLLAGDFTQSFSGTLRGACLSFWRGFFQSWKKERQVAF